MTRILLLGGASEIGLAIVAELVREATRRVDRGGERWLRCEPAGRASKPREWSLRGSLRSHLRDREPGGDARLHLRDRGPGGDARLHLRDRGPVGDRGEERWLRCEPEGRASKPRQGSLRGSLRSHLRDREPGGHESVEVVLAGRPGSAHRAGAIAQMEATGAKVTWLDFDAAAPEGHPDLIEAAFAEPVDAAIVAFGLLGERGTWRDHEATMRLVQTNYTGALSVGVLLAQQFTAQGYGRLIAISSVAGERVRRSNLVYGSTKAGMDGFYLQLGVELAAEGIQVLVVRPGTVRGRMAAARGRVPLSSTPEQVARRTVDALLAGRAMVRIPAVFGPISAIFRNLPAWLANRMPF